MAAYADGRVADARTLSLRFQQYEQSFGPDLAGVRGELDALARASTRSSTPSRRASCA